MICLPSNGASSRGTTRNHNLETKGEGYKTMKNFYKNERVTFNDSSEPYSPIYFDRSPIMSGLNFNTLFQEDFDISKSKDKFLTRLIFYNDCYQ